MSTSARESALLFLETKVSDLDRILSWERQNADWICPYHRDRHLASIRNVTERHISVFRERDNHPVGFLILQQIDSPHRSLEFRRFVIAETGQGYGRQCLRWVKWYCFEELGFHRMWFDVFADNHRAIKLYESEGFRREGTLVDNFSSGGTFRSMHLYAMLDREYFQGQERIC